MVTCPHCHSTSGQLNAGAKHFFCKAGNRNYTPFPKAPGYPEETRRQAVRLYLEGHGFRVIGRILHANPQPALPA